MNFNVLKNHTPRICDQTENREFAVLIPIVQHQDKPCIAFQIRSGNLIKQPNEICFPGGKIEPAESPLAAALRETCEELLINEAQIELIGPTDVLVTPFNSVIYPFAAVLHHYTGSYSKDEVQEVFYVPLDFFKAYDPLCSYLDIAMLPNEDFPFDKIQYGKDYPWAKGRYPVYLYEYEGKVIWGITARVLRNFLELIEV